MLEAERGVGPGGEHETAGHPQVDHQIGAVVEGKEEVLAAPLDGDYAATDEARGGGVDPFWTHDPWEGGGANADDRPADDAIEQRATDGFDFGEFWHTWDRLVERPTGRARAQAAMVARTGWVVTEAAATEDCVFCRIVRGEFGTPFLAESDLAVAFRDLHPQTPTHVLIVPRRHIPALRDLDDDALAADLLRLAVEVARRDGLLDGGGYRLLTNDGPDAGQSVNHLHFHVLGGRPLSAPLG